VKGRRRLRSKDGAKLRIFVRGRKVRMQMCGEGVVAKVLQDRANKTCEEERPREEALTFREMTHAKSDELRWSTKCAEAKC
jgi:translation initiation factor IF-3